MQQNRKQETCSNCDKVSQTNCEIIKSPATLQLKKYVADVNHK